MDWYDSWGFGLKIPHGSRVGILRLRDLSMSRCGFSKGKVL